MSGTLGNTYNNISFALNLHSEVMARLQEQVSTGARINRASDSPSAAYRILGLNSEERLLDNYIENLSDVISTVELSSNIIADMLSGLTGSQGVKTRLTQITSGTYSAEGRKNTAEGIDEQLEQMLMLANTKRIGQYLFGGSNTSSAPYVATRDGNGKITKVTYNGSLVGRDIEVAPGVESSALYVGDNIFRSNDRGTPQFILGNTGVTAGTGTSSVTGFTWLTVADAVNEKQTITITGGPPTSGQINIAFGAADVEVDFDADAATVQAALEGLGTIGAGNVSCSGTSFTDTDGITIEFTGALELTNVEEMVVSNSIIDPLDAGAPAISTDTDGGKQLSIDGGTAVGIPIGDKTNVAITNPDGQVLYVNAAGIINVGVELVAVPGTHDIFNTLITIRDLLKNEKGHTDVQSRELLNNSFDSLNELSNLLAQTQATVGSRINFLDTLEDNLTNMKYNTEDETTRLEEADIAQLAIDLSRREVLYQMSLAMAAKLMSMSLLDFL
ncbi:MAG TPA: flagellar hook-associated protein FlgL [Planctomycetes bacterium]|nr:flagellar hook-associated protein FlgL [Planctomycetota bacterium]